MTRTVLACCLLAFLAGVVWTIRGGWGDGSWLLLVVPAAIAALVLGVTKEHTGKWITDDSGGR